LRLQSSALQFEIANQERDINKRIAQINQASKAQVIMNGDYGKVPHAIG